MTPKYLSVCEELLLKFTVFLMFVFSTTSTTQCTPKKTERDFYGIRDVGIKLCQVKCVENGQCLSIEYNIDTLTCRVSRWEPQKMKKIDGFIILARDQSHVLTGSCTPSMCSFGQLCLSTRSGNTVCVQDEKQNYPEKSPHHTVETQETFVNNQLHEACRKGGLFRVRLILAQGLLDINSRDEKHGRTPLMLAAKAGHCRIFALLINKGANTSEVDNDCKNAMHWACKGGHMNMVECVLQQNGIVKNALVPPLLQAAIRGNTEVVEFLVCTGSNVSQVDGSGRNVLHYACSYGHMALAKYLVSQGSVDINSAGKDGRTPLMEAASKQHTGIFKLLVSMGANVSCIDDIGNNVLHLTCRIGKRVIVQYLVSQGSVNINSPRKDGRTPLMETASQGDPGLFKFLVRMGANVSRVDDMGNNVLHFATTGGQIAMVQYLVSRGIVDINSRRGDGRTPLMEAALGGHTDIFKCLVSMGANVSCIDDIGNSALHLTCRIGKWVMVKYLVAQGSVNINSPRKDGRTPLMETAAQGDPGLFKFLVRMGANVSRVDDMGNNVLHFATRRGHTPMVHYLVSRGIVDINSRREDGRTPLMEAAVGGKRKVFEILVNKGANVSHVDVNGKNILHLASSCGLKEMVKHILSKNMVDINARDKDGQTAAMIARRYYEVYELLVSKGCPVK